MNQNQNEINDASRAATSAVREDSNQETEIQILPEEAPVTVEAEDVDIHGKLAHLNAVDLSKLTLSMRHAMITLMQPRHSDELGRFMTTSGTYPSVTGLTSKEVQVAVESLQKMGLIETWQHGGSTCWEVAGAYAYKPKLKWHLNERRKIATKKKQEREKRRQRKKDLEAGNQFVYEDDNMGMADDGEIHQRLLTTRGNLVSNQAEFFYQSNVPPRKGKDQYKMILAQPETTKGCILRMLPSFNPAEHLSPLAAVIRFYLTMDCDDFGRVRVDVQRIYGQLGAAITKRVSKEQIRSELMSMQRSKHLILFEKIQGNFAYVRDTAQHLKKAKALNRGIPRLYRDREFTYDSEDYKAFFRACADHSAKRDKVRVNQFNKGGDCTVIYEYAQAAARRFEKTYERLLGEELYCNLTPEQFCDLEEGNLSSFCQVSEFHFFHGVKNGFSATQMAYLYRSNPDLSENSDSIVSELWKILTHLIGMTPLEYVELLKSKESNSRSSVVEEEPLPFASADKDEEEPLPICPLFLDEEEPMPVAPFLLDDEELPQAAPVNEDAEEPLPFCPADESGSVLNPGVQGNPQPAAQMDGTLPEGDARRASSSQTNGTHPALISKSDQPHDCVNRERSVPPQRSVPPRPPTPASV